MNKNSLYELKSKKVYKILVIGSSRGLGKEFINSLDNEEIGRIYQLLLPTRDELNLLNLEDTQKYIKENKPDIVINFAVTNKDSFIHKTNLLYDKDSLDSLNLGTTSQFNLVQSALVNMRQEKFGRIILFSSIIKEQPQNGTSIYGCSKAFVEQLSKHVAKENASYGITCNTIQLGYCETGLINKVDSKILENLNIPAKRLCSANEVNKMIISVLTNPYINGSTLQLNGGL